MRLEHLDPVLASDLAGAIDAARIDDNNLIKQPVHRAEIGWKVFLLVPDDQSEGHPGLAPHRRRLGGRLIDANPDGLFALMGRDLW